MEPSVIRSIQFGFLVVLILLSAFFSSAETALTTVNKVRLQGLEEEGNKRAKIALILLSDSSKMLSSILVMNNIVNLSASALATTISIEMFGNKAVAFATGILTFVLLIFGEITPKTVATIKSEELTLVYASPVYFVCKVLAPIVVVVEWISASILKLMKINPEDAQHSITEYELRSIVNVSQEEGVIESEEREMINNVVDLGDSYAKDVMIPRVDMAMINVDATYDELKEVFFEHKYTRMPVYEESNDNIVGIVNMKDFLFYENYEGFSLKGIMREPNFTFEYKKTSDLLAEMRKNSISMIFVLDEYGATVGLITLEDLLEEIVGEIRDEYDEDEEDLIKMIADRVYDIDGSVKLDDINDALGTKLESKEYDSIGGLVIEQLEDLPETGDTVTLEDGTILTVLSMDKMHIEHIKMQLPERVEEEETEEEEAI